MTDAPIKNSIAEPSAVFDGPVGCPECPLGQRFRLSVTDGLGRRSAVFGEKALQSSMPRTSAPYVDGGDHDISIGLLLRTDIHLLFDVDYVTVTERNHFTVSERLKADFDNGAHYFVMQGTEIGCPRPGFASPVPEALRWHCENRYLG